MREVPYSGMTRDQVILSVAIENTRPKISPNKIPEQWRKLIESCWSTDPNLRPSFTVIRSNLGLFVDSFLQKQKTISQNNNYLQPPFISPSPFFQFDPPPLPFHPLKNLNNNVFLLQNPLNNNLNNNNLNLLPNNLQNNNNTPLNTNLYNNLNNNQNNFVNNNTNTNNINTNNINNNNINNNINNTNNPFNLIDLSPHKLNNPIFEITNNNNSNLNPLTLNKNNNKLSPNILINNNNNNNNNNQFILNNSPHKNINISLELSPIQEHSSTQPNNNDNTNNNDNNLPFNKQFKNYLSTKNQFYHTKHSSIAENPSYDRDNNFSPFLNAKNPTNPFQFDHKKDPF